jgi:SAM-dependent methyltransferase
MLAPRKTLWSTPDIVIDRIAEIILTSSQQQEPGISYNSSHNENDTIVDIGCGTGRVLIRLAEKIYTSRIRNNNNHHHHPTSDVNSSSYPRFIGIDIDQERITTAKTTWQRHYIEQQQQQDQEAIVSNISMNFYCMNAILHPEIWMNPSISMIYVYITPRGMKQLLSIIISCFYNSDDNNNNNNNENCDRQQQNQQQQGRRNPLKVISYMNPFPSSKDNDCHTMNLPILLRHKEYVTIPHQPDTAYPIYFYEIG